MPYAKCSVVIRDNHRGSTGDNASESLPNRYSAL